MNMFLNLSRTSQRSGAAGSQGQSLSAQITLEPSSFNTSHSPSPQGPWNDHVLYLSQLLMIMVPITATAMNTTWLRRAWQERSSGHQTWSERKCYRDGKIMFRFTKSIAPCGETKKQTCSSFAWLWITWSSSQKNLRSNKTNLVELHAGLLLRCQWLAALPGKTPGPFWKLEKDPMNVFNIWDGIYLKTLTFKRQFINWKWVFQTNPPKCRVSSCQRLS